MTEPGPSFRVLSGCASLCLCLAALAILLRYPSPFLYGGLALGGAYLLVRMGRPLFAGKGIPLSEWFATFLAGAATATFSAMLIPEGDEAPLERTKLTVIIVALSFISAFAGSAFAWFHIASFGEQEPRLRWRWILYSWAFTLLPWIALYAYFVATVR